jgi:TPR repeat protein
MCELAYCYKNGIGVAKDEAEAAQWFRSAAKSGAMGAERELEELEQA